MTGIKKVSVLRPDDRPYVNGIEYLELPSENVMSRVRGEMEDAETIRSVSFTNDMTIWYSDDYLDADLREWHPFNVLAYRLVTFLNGKLPMRGPVVVTGRRHISQCTVDGLSKSHVQLLNMLKCETVSMSLSLTAQRDALPIDLDGMFDIRTLSRA